MAGITIKLVNTVTNDEYQVELPHDIPISRVLPALLTNLQLPVVGPNGQPMSYRLQTENNQVLQETDTLGSAGLQDGATINLTTEMEAGAGRRKR